MPILTLNLTEATNDIELPAEVHGQHLTLKMYSVVFPSSNFSDTAVFLDMVGGQSHWLSADVDNGISNSDPSNLFMLPVYNQPSHGNTHTRGFNAYPDIKLSAHHIPKKFRVDIYGQDAQTLIIPEDLTSLRLIFEYDFPTK